MARGVGAGSVLGSGLGSLGGRCRRGFEFIVGSVSAWVVSVGSVSAGVGVSVGSAWVHGRVGAGSHETEAHLRHSSALSAARIFLVHTVSLEVEVNYPTDATNNCLLT